MFRTFTLVVRMSPDDIRDLEQGQVADPRQFFTDDEVMFWGEESGISPTAMTLGAEPGDWADDDEVETEYRVTLDTMSEQYVYHVDAWNEDDALSAAIERARNDGMTGAVTDSRVEVA